MQRLTVRHVTAYRYAEPVSFGEHRLMLRPRDSHDLRLVSTRIAITPEPSGIRWLHDVFGNSVAVVAFETSGDLLRIESEIDLELYDEPAPDFPIERYAARFPFAYSAEEMPDLTRLIERHYPDPDHAVDDWSRSFLEAGSGETLALLDDMTRGIQRDFTYAARDAEGVQTPIETLASGSGSCRDFAVLMMEAARSLGLAARFVSGYVHAPFADPGAILGGGATHAWVQVYLPGAGWLEFDPTNGIVGNRNLIRVAVVRVPGQAAPVSGNWSGPANAALGMEVDVTVVATEDVGTLR